MTSSTTIIDRLDTIFNADPPPAMAAADAAIADLERLYGPSTVRLCWIHLTQMSAARLRGELARGGTGGAR